MALNRRQVSFRAAQRWIDAQRRTTDGTIALIALAILLIVFTVGFVWNIRYAFAIDRLSRGVGDTVFYTRDGRPWFRLDESRREIPLERISPALQHAVVAVEDHRFRWHPGFDVIALSRAVLHNIWAAGIVEGGSTITQQLARTLFLSNRRTVGRKLQETGLAVMLEQRLTKDQILELYLNRIYLGGRTYGVGTMSNRLFGKDASELTLSESALLAGLIRAPSSLSPWSNPDAAMARRDVVLARMREEEFITPAQEQAARRAQILIRQDPTLRHAGTGYMQEYLRDQFRREFGHDHPADWRVHTSVLPEVQHEAERAVTNGLNAFGIPDLQATLVALDPQTGDVLAMVGGRDVTSAPFNRATLARRQPGSAFKPFLYASGLERGLTPVTVISDLASMAPVGTEEWVPANADGSAVDALTIREALVESNNRAAVRFQQTIGTGTVLRLATRIGLSEMPDVPSLALGTGLVSPLQLTAAYAAFANGGDTVRPRALLSVRDQNRAVVLSTRPRRERVLSPETAYQMVSMLQDVVQRGTASAARGYGIRAAVAGKTGSTNEHKDAWFVGFSSAVVAGVWVGFDEPRPIAPDAYGARYALPIWSQFMARTAQMLPARGFEPPPSLKRERICRTSGMRARENCPAYEEFFKKQDSLPTECPLVHRSPETQRAGRRSTWERFLGGLVGWLKRGR